MSNLTDYTRVSEWLPALFAIPEVLIVLNHPFWLEEGVEENVHRAALPRLLGQCGQWLHAFELNGTRPWKENHDTIELALAYGVPVISGGDRHACEPSACINLTNARSFAEFTAEIREGRSRVLFLPQYRRPMAARLAAAVWDILRPYPEFPHRACWTDRVFYQIADGVDRPLSQVWKRGTPGFVNGATQLVGRFAAALAGATL